MNENKLIQISLNEEELKELFLSEVQKRLDKIELDSMLMTTKELRQTLNLSWPTIEKLFLADPNFPSIRMGSKWLFNRRAVQEYIDRWFMDIKENGGKVDIQRIKNNQHNSV